jgi:tetratricopeptide (TPR) repeat protein
VLLRAHSGGYRGEEEENALENILSIYGRFEDRREQVRTYQIVGGMTFVKTSQEKAKPFFEASLALARETGFQAGIACAEHCLGIQSYATGDYEQVERWLDKSITHLRGLGDEPDIAPLFLNINQMPFAYGVHRRWRIVDEENFLLIRHFSASSAVGYALANQGNVARAMGEHARAATLYEASRAHFAEIADQSGLSQVLGQIGYLFALMRDDSRARAALESSLALRRELGNRRGIGRSLHNLANVAILGGDYVHARAWLDESLDLFQEILDEPGLAQTFNHLGNWALEQDDFALAETFYEKGLNLFAEFGDRGAGRMLLNLAECALGEGDADLARTRLERARAALNAYGDRLGAAAVDEQLKHLADAERARK